jgi:hypothetical protein
MSFRTFFESKKSITFIDIDDTLFETHALIYVIKDGSIVRKLTNQEFNVYELQDGESFDFREFRSSDIFINTSNPIESMIKKLIAMFNNISKAGSDMYLLTARGDFDNKQKFLDFLKSYGIPVGHVNDGKIHVIRAGNKPGNNSAIRKKEIIRDFLLKYNYSTVRLYDDAISNLNAFKELQEEFKHIKFESYVITHGKVKKY